MFKLCKILFLSLFLIKTFNVKAQNLFLENFEGNIDNKTSLPIGWNKMGMSKDKIYQIGDSTDAVFVVNGETLWSVPEHTKFAFTSDVACSYILGGQNCDKSQDRLILPEQDFTNIFSSILLSFDSFFTGKLGSIATVEYSLDNGANWIFISNVTANSFWSQNHIDLTHLANKSKVLISFKFNDNNALRDGFAIDNVVLKKVEPWIDLKIISSDLTKYSIIPSTQLIPLPLNCLYTNQGSKLADTVAFSLKVYSTVNQKKLIKEYSKIHYSIKQKDTIKVDFGNIFSNELTDAFEFEFSVFNKKDSVIENNFMKFNAVVSLNEYARDDNQLVSVLGLSSSNTITLGNMFEINRASYIDSVYVILDKKNMALGSNFQAVVYPIVNKVPLSNPIGYSAVYTINAGDTASKVILKVTDSFLSRLKLDSGKYLIAINKYTNGSSLAVKMTNKYFSEEAVYVKIGDANFQTLDTYFSGAYKLVPSIRMYCSPFCNLNVKIKEKKADCVSGIGSLIAIPLNGSFPFKFSWSNSTKDSILSNVKVGKYSFTLEDKFSCKFDTNNITLRFNTSPRITVDSISHPTCFGANNGFVSMKIEDENKLTKIFWNSKQTNTVFNSNMTAGAYSVKVFNDANCSDSAEVILSSPDSLRITSTFTNETTKSKGEIFLFVSGGVQPYSFLWNDSLTTKNRLGIDGDKNYSVIIKDANGCEKNRSFSIEKILQVSEFSLKSEDFIYPNPSSGVVYVDNDESVTLTIEDFDGKSILTLFLNELNNKIDLSHLAKGIYIFRLTGKNTAAYRKISII
jgi:hypothetical protein